MLGFLLLMLPTQITQEYDRIEDDTTLQADLGVIYKGKDLNVTLDAYAHFSGEGRKKRSGGVSLLFFGTSDDGWRYLDYHPIVLLLDGTERLRFNPDHDGDVGKGYVTESMFVYPTAVQFQQLTAAKSVEGVIGIDRFSLTPKQIELLKRFAVYAADPDAEIKQPVDPEEKIKRSESTRFVPAKPAPTERKPTKEEQQRIEDSANKQKSESYLRIAELLRQSKKYQQARKIYEEVIRDFPKYPAAKEAKERLKTIPKG